MMQVSKKIPFEDPNVLIGVRALYIVSNLIILGVYMYTKMQIDKKKGTSPPSLLYPFLPYPTAPSSDTFFPPQT